MKYLSVFFLLISGCSNIHNEVFITKELPKAKVGEKYYAEIRMEERGIIENLFYVDTNINKGMGMEVIPNQNPSINFSHSLTIIKGVPNKSGIYTVNISGVVRGGNKDFDKKYILEVRR